MTVASSILEGLPVVVRTLCEVPRALSHISLVAVAAKPVRSRRPSTSLADAKQVDRPPSAQMSKLKSKLIGDKCRGVGASTGIGLHIDPKHLIAHP